MCEIERILPRLVDDDDDGEDGDEDAETGIDRQGDDCTTCLLLPSDNTDAEGPLVPDVISTTRLTTLISEGQYKH